MPQFRKYALKTSWHLFPLWTLYMFLPLLCVYAPRATVILLVVGALSLIFQVERLNRVRNLVISPTGIAIVCLIGWSLLTTVWSGDILQALYDCARMALIHVFGFAFLASVRAVSPAEGRSLCVVLLLVGFVSIPLLGIEISTDAQLGKLIKMDSGLNLTTFAGSTAVLAVFTWPVLASITLRTHSFLWPVAFLGIVFLVLTQLTMFASVLAFIIGLIAFLLTYKFPGRAPIAMVAVFSLLFVSAPWISLYGINLQSLGSSISFLPLSHQHRLGIWNFVSGKALERSVLGHGYDASRRMGRENQKIEVVVQERTETSSRHTIIDSALPLHPHNSPLQIWLELGGVGTIICVILLLTLTKFIANQGFRPLTSAMVTATLASFLSISSVSYGIWQKWWLATAWIAAATCVLVIRQAEAVEPVQNPS